MRVTIIRIATMINANKSSDNQRNGKSNKTNRIIPTIQKVKVLRHVPTKLIKKIKNIEITTATIIKCNALQYSTMQQSQIQPCILGKCRRGKRI